MRRVASPISLLFLIGSASAQVGGSGAIQGTITDPSGAVVAGAAVTAIHTATGVKTARTSTDAGVFALPLLPAGEYDVVISARGFQTQASILKSDDVALGSTMQNDVYDALPLAMNGAARDPSAFVGLASGVSNYSTQAAGPSTGSFNGGQTYQNETYIEGLPLTSAGTESDTRNQFHGGVFEYFRNTDFDARGFFALTTPIEHQNEFGASISGPIRKNKMFFFGNYDGYRFDSATPPGLQSIPSAAERTGDVLIT